MQKRGRRSLGIGLPQAPKALIHHWPRLPISSSHAVPSSPVSDRQRRRPGPRSLHGKAMGLTVKPSPPAHAKPSWARPPAASVRAYRDEAGQPRRTFALNTPIRKKPHGDIAMPRNHDCAPPRKHACQRSSGCSVCAPAERGKTKKRKAAAVKRQRLLSLKYSICTIRPFSPLFHMRTRDS